MRTIEKWADRVYTETDIGRSIATSLAGTLGLAVYLLGNDWVIAAFSSIILFPAVRIVASIAHKRLSQHEINREKQKDAEQKFNNLSNMEKDVVLAFVNTGSCVLTWGQMNKSAASGMAVESLIQREIIFTSLTADGMRETFVLDPIIFDLGAINLQNSNTTQPSRNQT